MCALLYKHFGPTTPFYLALGMLFKCYYIMCMHIYAGVTENAKPATVRKTVATSANRIPRSKSKMKQSCIVTENSETASTLHVPRWLIATVCIHNN